MNRMMNRLVLLFQNGCREGGSRIVVIGYLILMVAGIPLLVYCLYE